MNTVLSERSSHVPSATTKTGRGPPPNAELPAVAATQPPWSPFIQWRRASAWPWLKLAMFA